MHTRMQGSWKNWRPPFKWHEAELMLHIWTRFQIDSSSSINQTWALRTQQTHLGSRKEADRLEEKTNGFRTWKATEHIGKIFYFEEAPDRKERNCRVRMRWEQLLSLGTQDRLKGCTRALTLSGNTTQPGGKHESSCKVTQHRGKVCMMIVKGKALCRQYFLHILGYFYSWSLHDSTPSCMLNGIRWWEWKTQDTSANREGI